METSYRQTSAVERRAGVVDTARDGIGKL